MATEILVPFLAAVPRLEGADLLLFRAHSLISHAIQTVGESRYNHVGTVAWVRGPRGELWVPYCIDTMEGRGGDCIPLRHVLKTYPGWIDVYEPNPDGLWTKYSREGCERWLWENIPKRPYGKQSIWRFALRHIPGIRWFLRPSQEDGKRMKGDPVCSSARAIADRVGGGVDPVPNLADEEVQPGHLARSPFYRYKFTLKREKST